MRKLLFSFFSLCIVHGALAQDALTYRTPPAEIAELALAAPTPAVLIDGKGKVMIILSRSTYPTVEDLAKPEYKLAGMRINPAISGPSRDVYYTGMQLQAVGSKPATVVSGLPASPHIGNLKWSPSGRQVAFTNTTDDAITAWVLDIGTGIVRQYSDRALNATMGNPLEWLDEEHLLVMAIPSGRGVAPVPPAAPSGPTVQETTGKAAPAATYQDLLKNPFDEQLFDYYFSAEPVILSGSGAERIGEAAVYTDIKPSPDKQYLLVRKVHRPYSYLVPLQRFPTTVQVWKRSGEVVKTLGEHPLDEIRPTGFDATVSFPRSYGWRSDVASTVTWVQALDGGDPRRKVAFRDAVYMQAAPFDAEPVLLAQTTLRFRRMDWGNGQLALLSEGMNSTQQAKISRIDPSHPGQEMKELISRSTNDRYNDPGEPIYTKGANGQYVLYISKRNELLWKSDGASPEGDQPLLASWKVDGGKRQILWRSKDPYYEEVTQVVDPENLVVITTRESTEEPPNYYLRDLKKNKYTALTAFTHPQASLLGVRKQLLKYKRKDGVDLTAMLYTPKGYDAGKDGRLPVLMWAYPREYRSASDAAQVRGSRYRFTRVGYGSPLFWVVRGYAVMDATEMPVVGSGDKEPNDDFVNQVVMNAEAAVSKITEMGIGDRDRIAVGGHSYGAFMTANLLAHTNLFRAGIARSGAYNRTLTPFGFQNEQRTYWQAPTVYYEMSPFSFANKIKTPILLIHGEADNNSGTFPIQSERLFNALKGNGATARLVFLPYESHGYAAKENILHMLWEMDQWLEKYVKQPAGKSASK
ncbi:prolyl oligopeptidase family serine peptidase [Chitinophaga pendula]|uniref:S9 family peptidase n=1 Tax=Chitinophaga TaxID=79328 RepID=UPI000BB01052|nr:MULTISPECIES: prolyl oligopeptidase family serine peptidase [Chitinophaga]ASZ10724.1 S9 family peptidase [Chitinophaga sp. MD30]UCJ06300.1 prolyl oligopeptidase family serine peptidase [Chitinophaga pendula]